MPQLNRKDPALPPAGCALERMAHLCGKVCAEWGQSGFEAYANTLILDARDGNRQGLPWDVAQELHFLGELSIAKRALVAAEMTQLPFRKVYNDLLANAENQKQVTAAKLWSDPRVSGGGVRRDRVAPRRAARPAPTVSWWRRLFG